MTHFFGIRDPGRAGGSWLIYCLNQHPAPGGIAIVGEAHMPAQLGSSDDARILMFLKAQEKQGRLAAGSCKCFHGYVEKFIKKSGGRIVTLLRNPMELVGCWRKRRSWVGGRAKWPPLYIGHPIENERDAHLCLLHEVRGRYVPIIAKKDIEPIIRIEDLNRSCGSDGRLMQAVCEHITQVPFPMYYIRHIQEHYLPNLHYFLAVLKNDEGVAVAMKGIPVARGRDRTTWADDTNPTKFWNSWPEEERELFREFLQPICEQLGYNCTDNPGVTNVDWPMKGRYPWAHAEDGLEFIPYVAPVKPKRQPGQ